MFDNKLSEAELERLAMLAEECGEVVQMVGKVIRHGYQSSHPDGGLWNRALLHKELADVIAVYELMVENCDFPMEKLTALVAKKRESMKKWCHHQTFPS
jgi:NTP pyrophosphatase (non-canonical NTP hydrolase)